MRYICFDLEATCKENDKSFIMETIEIGATCIVHSEGRLEVVDTFQTFVKPIVNPVLTPFCKQLTGIKQFDVDDAERFPQALNNFLDWCRVDSNDTFMIASWGFYDKKQLTKDCQLHRIQLPQEFENHVSVKHLFSQAYRIKPCGVKEALKLINDKFEGSHHRALDDAQNISKLFIDLFQP